LKPDTGTTDSGVGLFYFAQGKTMDDLNYEGRWKWFTYSDFVCRCGCGRNHTDPILIDMLDSARSAAGVPFLVNSGYRCPAHNQAIGSHADNHPSGEAADIRCTEGPVRIKMIVALINAGFRRIGFHNGFIHADRMDQSHGRVQSFWPY